MTYTVKEENKLKIKTRGRKLSFLFSQASNAASFDWGEGLGLFPTHRAEQMLLLESRMQPTLHSHGPQVCVCGKNPPTGCSLIQGTFHKARPRPGSPCIPPCMCVGVRGRLALQADWL